MVKMGKGGAIPPIPGAPVQVEETSVQEVGEHAVGGEIGVVAVILNKSP